MYYKSSKVTHNVVVDRKSQVLLLTHLHLNTDNKKSAAAVFLKAHGWDFQNVR